VKTFYLDSLLAGLTFGFLYALLFVKKIKKVYKRNNDRKSFKDLVLFSSVNHLLLIGFFAFLIFRLKMNILVTVTSFMLSFWGWLLLEVKFFKK